MTGTRCEIRFSEGLSDYIPNRTLGELLQLCMAEAGVPAFDDADRELASHFRRTLSEAEIASAQAQTRLFQGVETARRLEAGPLAEVVGPLSRADACMPGSTDVGDVSQIVPTGQIVCACTALGTGAHTWQFAAQAASSIGHKGMLAAGRVLALACLEVFGDPGIAERAKVELREKTGGAYECPIPADILPGGTTPSAIPY